MPENTWQDVVSQMSEAAEPLRRTAETAYVLAATLCDCSAAPGHDAGLSRGTTPRR